MTELAKAFEFLEAQEKGIIELESLLTAYPALAPESGGIGEIEKAAALEAWLKAQGISDIKHYDAPDPRVPSKLRPNLVATIRKHAKARSMSHLDVAEGELFMG